MSKITAVEWLANMLIDNKYLLKDAEHLFEEAKAIEKEQIIDARENGLNEGVKITNNSYYTKWLLSEDYYNETYGSQDD